MKNNYTDLFIQHSRKQLSDNQLIEFNQELKNNADFRTAFEEYELTRQFFIQKELFDVKDILNDIKKSEKNKNISQDFSQKLQKSLQVEFDAVIRTITQIEKKKEMLLLQD